MKRVGFYMLSLAISFAFFSCKHTPDMLTIVHGDGSITREFVLAYSIGKADSAGIRGIEPKEDKPFPIEVDSTWEELWLYQDQVFRSKKSIDSLIEKNTDKDIHYFYTIRKDFVSVENLANNFHIKKSHPWTNVKINYQLDKKFRWFYTDYSYKETYSKLNPKFTYPLDKCMSKNEADYWFSGSPNLTGKMTGMEARDYLGELEDKYENWLKKNLWSDQFDMMVSDYDLMSNKPVSKQKLIALKDTIFESASAKIEDGVDAILNAYFKTTVFSELEKQNSGARDSLGQAKYGALWEKFQYKLCMPGKILHSNCDVAGKATLAWNISGFKFLTKNYVIQAESRKANVWAFILTGFIIAVAIGSFFVGKKHRMSAKVIHNRF